MKKILFVHHTTSLGGATNSLLNTIIGLPKNYFNSEVLFLQSKGPASVLFEEKGIEVNHLPCNCNYQHAYGARIVWIGRYPFRPITQFFKMIFAIPLLKKYFSVNYSDVDIVHINTSIMTSVGIACKLLGKKIVWHNREILYQGLLGIRKKIVSTIINHCANIIIHISKMGLSSVGKSSKSILVYNFLDFKLFDKQSIIGTLKSELKLSSSTKIVTMLGGSVHSKGADVLIKTIPYVLKYFPDVYFVIVGYPLHIKEKSRWLTRKSVSEKCQDLIKRYSLEDKITFLGLRNDIPNILASTYILVWPATVPHFSRPIIEAQAMQVPAIGTDFEVTREIIKDNETGLLFKNQDEQSLSNKIIKLLSDVELYNKISNQGYKQAYEMFNAENNVSKIIQVYKSLS